VISFLSIAFLVYSLHESIGIIFICVSLVGLVFVIASVFAAAYRICHHMARAPGENTQGNEE